DRGARQHCPSPLHRHAQTTTHPHPARLKPDISTLQRIGHFYFALTADNLHGAHAAAHYPNTRFLVVTRSAPTTPGPPREDLRERAGVSLGLRPRDVVPLRATPHGRGSDQSRPRGHPESKRVCDSTESRGHRTSLYRRAVPSVPDFSPCESSRRVEAILAATRMACFMLRASAWFLPAMSKAVP